MTGPSTDTHEIPSAVRRRVLDTEFKRWTAMISFALAVGGVLIPAVAWALNVQQEMKLQDLRLKILESAFEDNRAMFRVTCVQADEELRAAAELKCPNPYRARRR